MCLQKVPFCSENFKEGNLTFNFSVFSKHFLILKTLISTVHVSEFLSPMDFSDVFYVVL